MANKIRVILFKDGDAWIAQGLEHDICAQAPSMNELYGRFEVAVHLESEEVGGLDRIPPAPAKFHEMWETKAAAHNPEWETDDFYEYAIAA